MVRVRGKTFEEIYGPTLDTHLQKLGSQNVNKHVRRDFEPHASLTNPGRSISTQARKLIGPTLIDTGRSRTMKPSQELKGLTLPQTGREDKLQEKQNRKTSIKQKTLRIEKNVQDFEAHGDFNKNTQQKKNKENANISTALPEPPQIVYQNKSRDEEDDAEEFFEMIKLTVENAVEKAIAQAVNCNLMDIHSKLDSITAELKATQSMLSQLHIDLNKKIVYYGEENARHFRYLCMKADYDKMFYHHQTMLAAGQNSEQPGNDFGGRPQQSQVPRTLAPSPRKQHMTSTPTLLTEYVSSARRQMHNPDLYTKVGKNQAGGDYDIPMPCSCGSVSNTLSINRTNDSADPCIRDVLGHIEQFCHQLKNTKSGPKIENKKHHPRRGFRVGEARPISKDALEADYLSSSDLSSRSMDQMAKYESKTIRVTSKPLPLQQ